MAAAVSQAPPIHAGLAPVWFLRQFELGESLATPIISTNVVPVGESLPGTVFLRDLAPGIYTFTVPSYGVDFGQAATVQLAAGTQTHLEVQSLRTGSGAGGDNFQRDTLYVRAISPYWARNISHSDISGSGLILALSSWSRVTSVKIVPSGRDRVFGPSADRVTCALASAGNYADAVQLRSLALLAAEREGIELFLAGDEPQAAVA